jgi:hypothetical protein
LGVAITAGTFQTNTSLSQISEKPYVNDVIQLYVDEETGVEYLIYGTGYKGGISVRYNADGSIKVLNESSNLSEENYDKFD